MDGLENSQTNGKSGVDSFLKVAWAVAALMFVCVGLGLMAIPKTEGEFQAPRVSIGAGVGGNQISDTSSGVAATKVKIKRGPRVFPQQKPFFTAALVYRGPRQNTKRFQKTVGDKKPGSLSRVKTTVWPSSGKSANATPYPPALSGTRRAKITKVDQSASPTNERVSTKTRPSKKTNKPSVPRRRLRFLRPSTQWKSIPYTFSNTRSF